MYPRVSQTYVSKTSYNVCTYHRVLKTFSNRFQDRPVRRLHRSWKRLEGSIVNVLGVPRGVMTSSRSLPLRRFEDVCTGLGDDLGVVLKTSSLLTALIVLRGVKTSSISLQ